MFKNSFLHIKSFKAFLIKDFFDAVSYKLQFFSSLFSIFIGTFIFFTLSKVFSGNESSLLEKYNNDYFAFALIGLALTDFTFLIAKSIGQEIRNGQLNGTFEELIQSSRNTLVTLTAIVSYPSIYGIMRVVIFFLIGIAVFDLEIQIQSNALVIFLIILFGLICYIGVALISASYIILFKKGDPFNTLFFGVSAIFGGVIYPIEALPKWSEILSAVLPITHILESLRACMISGDMDILIYHCFMIFFLSIVSITCGYILCYFSIKKAKMTGSLSYY